MEAGWLPREVITLKPRKEKYKGFQKHRVRFFNPKLSEVNGSFAEILLTNSYDAKSSFLLQLGVFRMICANGMVVGDTYNQEAVRHIGYSDQKVYDAIMRLLPQTDRILSAVDRFSTVDLSVKDQRRFGESILKARIADEEKGWIIDESAMISLFRTNRRDDAKTDLWTFFNRSQENLCRHGFFMNKKDEDGNIERRKVQAIKNTFRADPLNKAIWTITEETFELKQKQID